MLGLLSKCTVADAHFEEDGGFLGLRIDLKGCLVILYCLGVLLGLLGLLAVVVIVVEELLLHFCVLAVGRCYLECGLSLVNLTGAQEDTSKKELCLTVLRSVFNAFLEVCESGLGILCSEGFLGRCLIGETEKVVDLCGLFLCAEFCAVCGGITQSHDCGVIILGGDAFLGNCYRVCGDDVLEFIYLFLGLGHFTAGHKLNVSLLEKFEGFCLGFCLGCLVESLDGLVKVLSHSAECQAKSCKHY